MSHDAKVRKQIEVAGGQQNSSCVINPTLLAAKPRRAPSIISVNRQQLTWDKQDKKPFRPSPYFSTFWLRLAVAPKT